MVFRLLLTAVGHRNITTQHNCRRIGTRSFYDLCVKIRNDTQFANYYFSSLDIAEVLTLLLIFRFAIVGYLRSAASWTPSI